MKDIVEACKISRGADAVGSAGSFSERGEAPVRIVEHLIEAGVEAGEFYCANPGGAARNILYVLEGLKIAAQTRKITEQTVDREFMYVIQGLLL